MRDMGFRPLLSLGCSGLVAISLLAGCGGAAKTKTTPTPVASPKPTVKPTPRPTAVPKGLAGYGSLVDPILKQTLAAGATLLHAMSTTSFDRLGNQCQLAGDNIANLRASFVSLSVPKSASSIQKPATLGFKYVLGSTDECGIAADAGSKKQLKQAVSDLKFGLRQIAHVETTAAQWASSGQA